MFRFYCTIDHVQQIRVKKEKFYSEMLIVSMYLCMHMYIIANMCKGFHIFARSIVIYDAI